MRCLAVCQDELVIRMLDEILLPQQEVGVAGIVKGNDVSTKSTRGCSARSSSCGGFCGGIILVLRGGAVHSLARGRLRIGGLTSRQDSRTLRPLCL